MLVFSTRRGEGDGKWGNARSLFSVIGIAVITLAPTTSKLRDR